MLTVILQPKGSSLCGQCVVAMITGEPLEEVTAFMGTGRNYQRDMQRAFEKFGHNMAKRSEPEVPEGTKAVAFCRLVIDGRMISHWVCWDGSQWIDPLTGVLAALPNDWRCNIYSVRPCL